MTRMRQDASREKRDASQEGGNLHLSGTVQSSQLTHGLQHILTQFCSFIV